MNMHHIIITGASRGIGHATALLYASMGWNISICSRHCDYQMTQTQDAITAAGGQYFSFCGDMGNATDAEEFLAKAVQTFGTLGDPCQQCRYLSYWSVAGYDSDAMG